MSFTLHLTWRGRTVAVSVPVSDPTLEMLGLAIENETGTSFETLKLLVAGRKGQIAPAKQREQSATQAGLADGCKALLLASSAEDVTQVRTAHDLPLLRGFEDELKRAARRRRTARTDAAAVQPPQAEFTFQAYGSWQRPGLHPPPSEALKLLYRLASDPGILGVMTAHGYRVGLLSEMPPEGKVGISPKCILGVNINAGQEISLRLRTDDLKGFRKYERIRETLIHELAHMEYGEHDDSFKRLNSELGRECAAINARYAGGHSLMGDGGGPAARVAAWAAADDSARVSELDDPNLVLDGAGAVMAATARFSGRTLRQLTAAGGGAAGGAGGAAGGSGMAVAAAVTAPAAALTVAAALQSPLQQTVEDGGSAGVSCSSDDSDGGGEAAARGFEHFDEETERAEDAARQLGSLDDPAQTARHRQSMSAAALPPAEGGAAPLGAEPSGPSGPGAVAAAAAAAAAEVPAVAGTAGVTEVTPCGGGGASQVPPHLTDPMIIDPPPDVTADEASTAAPAAAQQPQPASTLDENCAPKNHSPMQPPASAATAAPPTPVQLTLQPPDASGGMSGPGTEGAADAVDAAQVKLRQAWSALAQMVAATRATRQPTSEAVADAISAADVAAALDTLETMLGNAVHFPAEDRYRRVRLGNGAFQRRVGRLPGGVDLLRVAGFVEERDVSATGGGGGGEAVLRLRRNDPGLMWLVLAAVREAKEQVAAQLAVAAGMVSQR